MTTQQFIEKANRFIVLVGVFGVRELFILNDETKEYRYMNDCGDGVYSVMNCPFIYDMVQGYYEKLQSHSDIKCYGVFTSYKEALELR